MTYYLADPTEYRGGHYLRILTNVYEWPVLLYSRQLDLWRIPRAPPADWQTGTFLRGVIYEQLRLLLENSLYGTAKNS